MCHIFPGEGTEMSLVINHNLMAANVARNLNTHYGKLAQSTQRLSTGLRVNSAADDAAGLAIRELQRADIAALHQGARNANDAVSMIQTADGALAIIDEKLIRMKELAEQAATGTYDSTQRLMIESEYQAMASEITRIANATDFNGIHLLNGNLSSTKHNGSGLTSTGKMKIHFGSGNDSAEDYYYIKIGETTSQAFGIGNASTWEDALSRMSITFNGNLDSAIESASTKYDSKFINAARDLSSTWLNEYINNIDKFTNFSSGAELEGLYNAFRSDNEVNELRNEFETAISDYDSISDRVVQKLRYALGHAAMRSIVDSGSVLNGFGDTTNKSYYVATGGRGLLTSNSNAKSAFYRDTSGNIQAYNDDDDYKFVYAPPIDYNPDNYISDDTTTSPTNYPLKFTAMSGFVGDIIGSSGIYHFDSNGILTSYKVGGTEMGASAGMKALANDLQDVVNDTLTTALTKTALTADNYDYAGYTIATQEDAQKALDAIQKAIVEKDKIRADLGALQNRLENTITNITTQAENLQAAESRISDVDVATEMTAFVRQQILAQSAVAMLSQANSMPQMAMQLIGG